MTRKSWQMWRLTEIESATINFRKEMARRLRLSTKSSPAHRNSCLNSHFPMAPLMIATAPANSRAAAPRMEFEHLLLGDLRELLNDNQGRERDRWLLATLDMLLVSRPRTTMIYLPVIPPESELETAEPPLAADIPFEKLQRLRDRIAHRAPYEALAQELIVDLRVYFEGSRSQTVPRLARVS